MPKRWGLLWPVLLILVFLLLNRASYRGYFQDDELDNIAWTSHTAPAEFISGLLTPRFLPQNFRPIGHGYFAIAGRLFGLTFPPYVAILQALHFLNAWLLWLLMRRLGAGVPAALASCAFFGLHMALFDAFWKPMYVFDVLCGTFCLLTLLAWQREKWIASFICFWLAYKCKELAVMLPLVILCYEWWFGKRRWKPAIPFFAVSLSFGLQALMMNRGPQTDYTFHFTPAALAHTGLFYAGRVFLIPYLGFAIPLAAVLSRSHRLWFGLAMTGILFVPLLFLPGRMYAAYCYVPFLGLAIALSAFDARVTAPLLLLWTPLEIRELRAQRSTTLALDDQVREWVTTTERFARHAGPVDAVVCSGHIQGFASWGVAGALRIVFHRNGIAIHDARDADAQSLLESGAPALVWDQGYRKLTVQQRTPETRDLPYLEMTGAAPLWQLTSGWHDLEGLFRWTYPDATARVERPASSNRFALRMIVAHPVTVRTVLNGVELAPRRFTGSGWQSTEWELPAGAPGPVQVEFHCDAKPLGMAVGGFGFIAPESPATQPGTSYSR